MTPNTKNFLEETDFFSINQENGQSIKEYIQNNIEYFISDEFKNKLHTKAIESKDNTEKKLIIFIISLMDELNKNNLSIEEITKEFNQKINEIIEQKDFTEQSIIISKKLKEEIEEENMTLKESNEWLEEWKKIVEDSNIKLIEKLKIAEGLLKDSQEKNKKLTESHNALFLFIQLLEKNKLIVPVENWKWKINPLVEISETKVIDTVKTQQPSEKNTTSPIVKKENFKKHNIEKHTNKPIIPDEKIDYKVELEKKEQEINDLKTEQEYKISKLNFVHEDQIKKLEKKIKKLEDDKINQEKIDNYRKTLINEAYSIEQIEKKVKKFIKSLESNKVWWSIDKIS